MIPSQRVLPKNLQAATSRQMGLTFESEWTRGLSLAERTRVLLHLSSLLMLAADVTLKERSDEPR